MWATYQCQTPAALCRDNKIQKLSAVKRCCANFFNQILIAFNRIYLAVVRSSSSSASFQHCILLTLLVFILCSLYCSHGWSYYLHAKQPGAANVISECGSRHRPVDESTLTKIAKALAKWVATKYSDPLYTLLLWGTNAYNSCMKPRKEPKWNS